MTPLLDLLGPPVSPGDISNHMDQPAADTRELSTHTTSG
jgi:hypothetical protein